jgi:hypothetical protein
MGVDFSGIFVFTGTPPAVTAGTRVTITNATVQNYFGQLELTGGMVMAGAMGAPPAPVMIANAMEVATGGARAMALEGVLVRVDNVTVTNTMPAPGGGETAPTNEFEVTGTLRVDDALYLTEPFPAMGENFASITGVLAFQRSNSKLLPRAAADLAAGTATLAPFTEDFVYARVGAPSGPTFPRVLTVRLTRAPAVDTPVALSATPAVGLAVSSVTIPAGMATAVVPVQGTVASATAYTVTATLGTSTQTAQVRVLGAAETPRLVEISPAMATVMTGGAVNLTVTLDIPAPPGGTTVTLSAGAGGTVPATVTVPANALTAPFAFNAGGAAATSTVTATLGADVRTAAITVSTLPPQALMINEVDYDNLSTDNAEFIEIYNGGSDPVDLANYAVVLVNGSSTPGTTYRSIPLGTGMLLPGAFIVVANTTVTLPAGVQRVPFPAMTDNIQNGAPDGIALVNTMAGTLVDALSYEGAIRMATVTGVAGPQSLVEGTVLPTSVADSNTAQGSFGRIPSGVDANNAATDWSFSTTPTPGADNVP